MKLDTQRKQFNIVLNVPNGMSDDEFKDNLSFFTTMLTAQGAFYAYIRHDKDIKDDGELKTLHYHIVLCLKSRKRVSSVLYMFVDSLKIPNECVQIEEVLSLPACIQYLIHKNDIGKYQYSWQDIYTNFTDDDLQMYLSEDTQTQVTPAYLYRLVNMGLSDVEIMFKIGVSFYNLYKPTIKMLKQEKQYNKKLWERMGTFYGCDKQEDGQTPIKKII